jgi:hypothetical protein
MCSIAAVETSKSWMHQQIRYGEQMPHKFEILLLYAYRRDAYQHYMRKFDRLVQLIVCTWRLRLDNIIITFSSPFFCSPASEFVVAHPSQRHVVEFAPISESSFQRMWKEYFSHVKIRRCLPFAKCTECDGKSDTVYVRTIRTI